MSTTLIPERPPLDTIYTRIGLGPYQFLCLFFVGCIYLTESMMNIFAYVISHSIKDEWELSETNIILLSIARDVGVVLTGFGCSWAGDKYGRLPVMKWGILWKVIGLMLAVVSLTFTWLLSGLFLVGLGLGFGRSSVSAFSIEILQPRIRGAILIGLFVFIISGAIGSAAMAIYLVPMLKPEHWRSLLFLASVPSIMGLLAANCLFIESPRYLVMIGKYKRAIRMFNYIALWNRQPPLSEAEEILVRSKPKRTAFSLKESLRRIFNAKYRSRFIYLMLMWFITGYQYTALMNSFPTNLGSYFANPLMSIEVATLPTAVFIPLPFVEMPTIGRRWTFMGFLLIQVVSSLIASVVSSQLILVAALLTNLFALTFSFRILYPFTLELFDTSIRCYTFGICYAFSRLGGLMSRFLPTGMHDSGLPVMLCMNFIGMMAIFHYPYETVQKPLDDYEA